MVGTLPRALDKLMQEYYPENAPGAALLIARGREVLYENYKGLADLNTEIKIDRDTSFRMASVSKQFTAMCLQVLQLQGLLKFNQPLSYFFPELQKIGHKITIKHLLTHTSGLPDYETFVSEDRESQITDDEVLQITANQPHTLFEPGTTYYYSNTGYVLLALLVERVSGMSYAQFLDENIFEPAGMNKTVLYHTAGDIPKRSMGYTKSLTGEYVFSDQGVCTATKGDGCIYTSMGDYLKWHQALNQNPTFNLNQALSNASVAIAAQNNWHYGMGWFFANRNDGTYEMYHTGNTSGFSNLVIRIPEHEMLIACFSNIADNPFLLTELLDTIQKYSEVKLQSDLVWHLQELTR